MIPSSAFRLSPADQPGPGRRARRPAASYTTRRDTIDKRRRFKNEIAFLARNKHKNIVSVIDHGVATDKLISGPFYVMSKYHANLRHVMCAGLSPEQVLPLFAGILDGVEAAHLQGAVHRDLKPENVLIDGTTGSPTVADFGIASFTDDLVATLVETMPQQRLANFRYAAPEQRVQGQAVRQAADIYALGLILNEMFTGEVPQGTEYQLISNANNDFGFLDDVVEQMIRQNPNNRYASIADVKTAISFHHNEFLALQKISRIDETVIPAGEIDEPLAHTPPKLIDFDWTDGNLTLMLDRPVNPAWVTALHNMRSFSAVEGIPPNAFKFSGHEARVAVPPYSVQNVVDHFKNWLPNATRVLYQRMQQEIERQEFEQREKLKRQRAAEEERLKVLRSIKI
jgi:serine/threonine protein kinase